ncbi:MBL fold metallo-hydrolase [Nocardiopsis sp. B62]|uniref:MBL fold metallo-hydrolase n=1 Tax=Nocardiopsis sp. B62 TaxID=2824874 RepID=UPI001B382082|nr:MBL fold metallo-hydrolase [Nocardiopsis sp. B62]MBQ1079908.1 MBL fold metallo-hydrolase [Nocardiopsis sp. B62]
MTHVPDEVAPGVHRVGDALVNFYLVETGEGLVMVDAGLPAHSGRFLDAVAWVGGRLRAVVLTHAHPDHTGLAERARDKAGARVWVHEADAPILADGPTSSVVHARPERPMLPYLARHPAAVQALLRLGHGGAFTADRVSEFSVFGDHEVLEEVPGRPRVVPAPGHTPGSVLVVFEDRGVAFTGDALVTVDPSTGCEGPRVVSRMSTHDSARALESLEGLATLPERSLLLPGHGAPFTEGPRVAMIRARATGVR